MVLNDEDDSVYIPIPHYPPFKLRSSLIDKDPVIWVHLLEAYIKLFKYLLEPSETKLNVKSQQQLQLFLKVFLAETSEEASKIFSLGAINPDIKTNTSILRTFVFLYIRNFSIVRTNLVGESIWNFVQIYVKNNATIVRGLIDGTFKSKFNDNKKSGSISSISGLHKYLESKITQGKYGQEDLTALSYLLGQQINVKAITVSLGGEARGSRNINKKSTSSTAFAESFVSVPWIETLEKLYGSGTGIHADVIRNIMVISVLSLSVAKISKLTMELGIKDPKTMKLFPLFSTIIISDGYKELVPNLEERLPFLRLIGASNESPQVEVEPVNEEHVQLLLALIPTLNKGKAIRVLKDHKGDVEGVTNMLLENPVLVESIEEESVPPITNMNSVKQPKFKINNKSTTKNLGPRSGPGAGSGAPVAKRSIYDNDKISNLDFSETSIIHGKKTRSKPEPTTEDFKQKTLTAALRLMYESDEDEPDDTYQDQEKTTGSAIEDNKKKGKKSRIAILEDDTVESSPSHSPAPEGRASGVDKNESYLFSLFKTKGPDVFGKTSRKSSDRQVIKKTTGWSDEQLEGWLRMLLKSPRRFKILEEDFFYAGNPNKLKKIQQSSDVDDGESESASDESRPQSRQSTPSGETSKHRQATPSGQTPSKITAARKEKNKASRANHNRKSGHNKKAKADLIGLQGG